MTSWAVPGAKCVCVDDSAWCFTHAVNLQRASLPKRGEVYVIRSVLSRGDGGLGLRLEGLDNSSIPTISGDEVSFRIARFRPLVTKTQEDDLAIFLPLLTDLRVGTDA